MLDAPQAVQSEMIASALQWWADAGIGSLVDETPQAWLKPKQPAPAVPATPQARPESLDTLASQWLGLAVLDGLAPPEQRILFSGPHTADLLVLVDMPEPGDAASGQLISGEAGELFEKMLFAMGRDRSTVLIAAMCPARPPGGLVQEAIAAVLHRPVKELLRLARPKRVWAMGPAASCALFGANVVQGSGNLLKINHDGGIVEGVASFSPRFLLRNPKRKAAAWADMKALMQGTKA